jgi:hypothetical protein
MSTAEPVTLLTTYGQDGRDPARGRGSKPVCKREGDEE